MVCKDGLDRFGIAQALAQRLEDAVCRVAGHQGYLIVGFLSLHTIAAVWTKAPRGRSTDVCLRPSMALAGHSIGKSWRYEGSTSGLSAVWCMTASSSGIFCVTFAPQYLAGANRKQGTST